MYKHNGFTLSGRYRILFIVIGLLFICSMYTNQSSAALFSDNFDLGASSSWGDQSGDWRAGDGVYDATYPSNSPMTYSDITTLTNLADFAVDVDVNGFNDGGLWLRSSYNYGSIDGVLLVTGGDSGSYDGLYWHIFSNGTASEPKNAVSQSDLQGNSPHLRVEVEGNTYSAFINNSATALTTLTDDTFSSGSVGLYDFSPNGASSSRGQTFDNFVVSAIPIPSALWLLGSGIIGIAGIRRRI